MAARYDGSPEPRHRDALLLALLEELLEKLLSELELALEQRLEERESFLDEAEGRGRGGSLVTAGTAEARAGTVRLRRRSSLAG